MGIFMNSIKELRISTNLTQKAFADKYEIPLSTLRKWEQGESRTPRYIIRYIEQSLPFNKDNYEITLGNNNNTYYIDKKNKKIGDSFGNWISFSEDIDGVIKENVILYIENLFNSYYEIVKKFDKDLFFDKKEKILWR